MHYIYFDINLFFKNPFFFIGRKKTLMDDNPDTISERDSLNQELDSLECHLDQR